MSNNSKTSRRNIIKNVKLIFHITNALLIIFYLYPGSIVGCLIYDDCKNQLQLTDDFSSMISSNHIYPFILVSFFGLVAYSKKKISNEIIVYLFFLSVFLEIMHLIIPGRGFEIKDLTGNIVGVVISLLIFIIFRKKNEFF